MEELVSSWKAPADTDISDVSIENEPRPSMYPPPVIYSDTSTDRMRYIEKRRDMRNPSPIFPVSRFQNTGSLSIADFYATMEKGIPDIRDIRAALQVS